MAHQQKNNLNDPPSILLPEAYQHYDQIDEANRLTGIRGKLELIRTRELLSRFLSSPPACIVDVGGGAGIHSFWLAEQGYDVHLIDAVSHHIETAKSVAKQRANPPISMQVGDARKLDLDDEIADAVLLLGPLYHLTSRKERVQCIAEDVESCGRMASSWVSEFLDLLLWLTVSHRTR